MTSRQASSTFARKIVVRCFALFLALGALHFLFLFLDDSRRCTKGSICLTRHVYHEIINLSGARKFSAYEDSLQIHLRKSITTPGLSRLWTSKHWRNKVDSFSLVFSELLKAEVLHAGDKALCVGAGGGQDVLALQEIGVDSVGIDLLPSPPLVLQGDLNRLPFPVGTFDFVFSNPLATSVPSEAVFSEIERVLKSGGFAVIRLSKKFPEDSSDGAGFTDQFKNSEVVHVRNMGELGTDYEILLRKRRQPADICGMKRSKANKVLSDVEPLIMEEPLKPWITLKENAKNIVYLPTVSDIKGRNHYFYVDVGARSYGSSIGSWFRKRYPKQDEEFFVYAVEADDSFAQDYVRRKNVQLLPYAAWVRNESLVFGANPENKAAEGEIGMGRIQSSSSAAMANADTGFKKVQGFDFSEWLLKAVTVDDFVVMKMDIEGTEFELLPRMIETGAICLVDELFLECHYNRWQRSSPLRTSKYNRTYAECLSLFQTLRSKGVLVHQWW